MPELPARSPGSPRSTWIWVLAAAAVVSLAPGRMALTDPDEARYAEASREMSRDGDIIVPHFNGEPRLSKPPLIYWMQSAAFATLGESETTARLPSLLAALCTLALVGWWAEQRIGAGAGGPAAAALSVTLLFFACARLAITDMLLCLCVTAALLLWYEAISQTGAARRRLAWAAAASIGLATLAKGPVGLALAAVVICATAILSRARGMTTWRGMLFAIAGVALVAGPWVAGLTGRIGADGIIELLKREALERSVWGLDHPRPSYYYLLTWWATLFPWSLAAPFMLVRALRSLRPRDPATLFLFCWLVGTLVFFSLPADKNDAYLLPAAPALALLAARWLPRRVTSIVSTLMGCALIVAAFVVSTPLSRDRSLKELALSADLSHRNDDILIAYRLYRPSLVFYAGRPARWVASGEELRRLLAEIPREAGVTIVMTEERLKKARADPRLDLGTFQIAGRQPGYVALVREPVGRRGLER